MGFSRLYLPFLLFPVSILPVSYVSTTGRDTFEGSAEKPFRTLQRALQQKDSEIRIQSGVYANTTVVKLNQSNLRITGGWNSDFSSQNDRSIFRGGTQFVRGENISEVEIDSIELDNFKGSDAEGLIHFTNCQKILIKNNFARNNLGIILRMKDCDSSEVHLEATENRRANMQDAAVMLSNCKNSIFDFNLKNHPMAGLYSDHSERNIYRGVYTNNRAGGGIKLDFSLDDTLESISAENNVSKIMGGGLNVRLAKGKNSFNLTGTFRNNEAGNGAGIALRGSGSSESDFSAGITLDVELTGNKSGGNGGGIYLASVAASNMKIRAIENKAVKRGGGIYAEDSINNSFQVIAERNEAFDTGGFYHMGKSIQLSEASVIKDNIETNPLTQSRDDTFKQSKISGLSKSLAELNARFESSFRFYGVRTITDLSKESELTDVERSMFIFLEVLSYFRPEWLRKVDDGNGLEIRFRKLNWVRGHANGAGRIALNSEPRKPDAVRKTFLHEMGHLHEYILLPNHEFPLWKALNPKGFNYANKVTYSGAAKKNKGLISDYASTAIEEDVAEIFAFALPFLLKEKIATVKKAPFDELVLKKIRHIEKRYEQIFPGIFADKIWIQQVLEAESKLDN